MGPLSTTTGSPSSRRSVGPSYTQGLKYRQEWALDPRSSSSSKPHSPLPTFLLKPNSAKLSLHGRPTDPSRQVSHKESTKLLGNMTTISVPEPSTVGSHRRCSTLICTRVLFWVLCGRVGFLYRLSLDFKGGPLRWLCRLVRVRENLNPHDRDNDDRWVGGVGIRGGWVDGSRSTYGTDKSGPSEETDGL